MKRKATIRIIIAAILLVALSGTAFAIGTYMPQFQNRYGVAGSTIDTCRLCHTIIPALNSYGTAFRTASRNFAAIEGLDSDGDGRTNIQEITAGTFPGEADGSAPESAVYTMTVTKAGSGSGTVTSAPEGISCGSDCSQSYSSGTSVTLTASASSGSVFAGWSGGGCSGTGVCTVMVGSNVSVQATFNVASTSGTPDISTPSSYSFGDEEVGVSKTRSITITNRGNATLTVSRIEMAGTHASMFRAAVRTFSVAPGATYSLRVTFTPTSEGTKTATMRLTSNDPDTPVRSIALSGRGVN